MAIDDKIRDKKNDINREAARISALSSGKIDKYKYLAGEEILAFDQSRITEQTKFTHSPLGQAFEKQLKTIETQGEKQIKAIEENGKQLVGSNVFAKKIICTYYYNFVAERMKTKEILHNSIDFNTLTYHDKGPLQMEILMILLM